MIGSDTFPFEQPIGSLAGVYLHVPFCRQACHYCNFHFSTSLRQKDALLDALCREIVLQKDYLGGLPLGSVYLGGGTPSLLSAAELKKLFDTLLEHHVLLPDAEVTLEANPDDLSGDWLRALRETPVNRLSIGIQSFRDEDLRLMNRAHNREQALQCIAAAQDAGFENLTVDLIYGIPGLSDEAWTANLHRVFETGITHLSCYALTVEPKTALEAQVRKGMAAAPDESQTARQFELLVDLAEKAGFVHYEISNFCRPPYFARHNSSYWRGVPYLGLGPSAHSFDGKSRQWNVANNAAYIQALQNHSVPFEREELSTHDRFNELLLTGLRTFWGVSEAQIRAFPHTFIQHFQARSKPWLEQGLLSETAGIYKLSPEGKLFADRIAMDLFVLSEEG